jgi:hypothetical protein
LQSLAVSRGTPDIDHLSSADQMELLRQLDADLKTSDLELWRTKQVNDFLAGSWGQVYGQIYETAIHCLFLVRFIARIVLSVGAILIGIYFMTKRIRAQRRRGAEVG